MLDNNKMIIVYGLDETDMHLLNAILRINMDFEYITVTKDMAGMTLKDITNGLKIRVANNSVLEEKLILFNNFNDQELENSIKTIRENFKSMPMLAVVTPTSIGWTFKDLLKHLAEEREWHRMRRGSTSSE